MANEITVTSQLKVTNGNQDFDKRVSITADQSAAGGPAPAQQNIGTTHEAIVISELTNLGWALFRNLDSTNYVEIGVDVAAAFYPFVKLLAGESCVVRLSPAIAPYAKANTAAVKLEAYIFEA